MRKWIWLSGVLAAAMLLAGCGAGTTSTAPSSAPVSAPESVASAPESEAFVLTSEVRAQIVQALKDYVDLTEAPVYASEINNAKSSGEVFDRSVLDKMYADLRTSDAYDGLQVLGVSNGWYVCLWQDVPTSDSSCHAFLGANYIEVEKTYFPSMIGLYLVKEDDVVTAIDYHACEADLDAVYQMLPEEMQCNEEAPPFMPETWDLAWRLRAYKDVTMESLGLAS